MTQNHTNLVLIIQVPYGFKIATTSDRQTNVIATLFTAKNSGTHLVNQTHARAAYRARVPLHNEKDTQSPHQLKNVPIAPLHRRRGEEGGREGGREEGRDCEKLPPFSRSSHRIT